MNRVSYFLIACIVYFSSDVSLSVDKKCSQGNETILNCLQRISSIPEIIPVLDINDASFDIVIVVTDKLERLTGNLQILQAPLDNYTKIDHAFSKQPILLVTDVVPSGRVIFVATGPLDRDEDDVRRFADAATAGIKRAVNAGCQRPLFVCPRDELFEKSGLVSNLAVLQALYLPLEIRELGRKLKVDTLGIWFEEKVESTKFINLLSSLEKGRIVARDIGGSDPERMTAAKVLFYLHETFNDGSVQVEDISDVETLSKNYPLLAAVNRAAHSVERHKTRLIFLEYKGPGEITKTLFIVGKGITYDTGGADVKAGGVMMGMHRDKCGAAAAAGFMKVVSLLKPYNLRVIAALPMVRNSIGEESYVADEIITSRAGMRVRVGNTDAEGRMVMADVLCHMKEKALEAVNPHLFTIATLTGHAVRAVGIGYSIIMDNGQSKNLGIAEKIQDAGEIYGDPFEISTIRREPLLK